MVETSLVFRALFLTTLPIFSRWANILNIELLAFHPRCAPVPLICTEVEVHTCLSLKLCVSKAVFLAHGSARLADSLFKLLRNPRIDSQEKVLLGAELPILRELAWHPLMVLDPSWTGVRVRWLPVMRSNVKTSILLIARGVVQHSTTVPAASVCVSYVVALPRTCSSRPPMANLQAFQVVVIGILDSRPIAYPVPDVVTKLHPKPIAIDSLFFE
mmetsp:Transcript_126891/g.237196  ORF Transcript_126891/g.237196 Transcript_126891/m.237196 type:complete len:215 (+) Transcript_126891:290-934(+)